MAIETVALLTIFDTVQKEEPAKYPAFIEILRGNLEKLYAECPFKLPQTQGVTSKFFSDANLIGALQCWLTENI